MDILLKKTCKHSFDTSYKNNNCVAFNSFHNINTTCHTDMEKVIINKPFVDQTLIAWKKINNTECKPNTTHTHRALKLFNL